MVTGTAAHGAARLRRRRGEWAAGRARRSSRWCPPPSQRIDPSVVPHDRPRRRPPPGRCCRPNVVTTYGMTETGSGVVYDGVPLDGVEVRLDDDGQILLRAPMLLRAYRDGTRPTRPGRLVRHGRLGSWAPDGRLVVHGRAGDLIITGGENVWPEPVEAVVARLARRGRRRRRRAATTPTWGQRVVAFVEPRRQRRPADARRHPRRACARSCRAYCAPASSCSWSTHCPARPSARCSGAALVAELA